MIERRLYRPAEAAESLGVSRATIYRMIHEQRVRVVVLNQRLRISADELERIATEGAPSYAAVR